MAKNNKRLIICCDGTWNEADKNPTNVFKLLSAIKPVAEDGKVQIKFYDQGVGVGGNIDRFIGGATGFGIAKNVMDAYRFLAHNYQAGDEIFCFGFSRGAYTVRALTGLINCIGMLEVEKLASLEQAYKFYRTAADKRPPANDYEAHEPVPITMLGVWDTVGALGVPTPLLHKLSRRWVSFHDLCVCENVQHAYHSIAMDEKRFLFKPALWTKNTKAPQQDVEQIWFAGAHSDIGGGYHNDGLSLITLAWMMKKAKALGLSMDHSKVVTQPTEEAINSPMHDSYSQFHQLMERYGSFMGWQSGLRSLTGDDNHAAIGIGIHASAIDKHKRIGTPSLHDRIANIPVQALKMPFSQDQRGNIRKPVSAENAHVIDKGDKPNALEIINFSSDGGVQLKGPSNIRVNENVALEAELFGKKTANCVWKKGDFMGMSFIEQVH